MILVIFLGILSLMLFTTRAPTVLAGSAAAFCCLDVEVFLIFLVMRALLALVVVDAIVATLVLRVVGAMVVFWWQIGMGKRCLGDDLEVARRMCR